MTQQWNSSGSVTDLTHGALSNSNLTYTSTANASAIAFGLNGVTAGKIYMEFAVAGIGFTGASDSAWVGLSNVTSTFGSYQLLTYFPVGDVYYYPGGAVQGTIASYNWTSGTIIIRVALDRDNAKAWFAIGTAGNNWNNDTLGNQNPATNTGGIALPAGLITSAVVPACGVANATTPDSVIAAFAQSSWVGTAPSGFGPGDPSSFSTIWLYPVA